MEVNSPCFFTRGYLRMPQQFHFAASEQKGSDSLGIVVHHRSVEIVVITPVICRTGAKCNMRNRTSNLYFSLHSGTDETKPGGLPRAHGSKPIGLGQISQPCAFCEGIGEHEHRGRLDVVPLLPGLIEDLVPQTALRVLRPLD